MDLKDCEVDYKETVDMANNFVQKFRKQMLKYCRQCRDLEIARCKEIHSAINQFVVFQMSAEMNNKYDAANFAKVLEEFSPGQEMKLVDQFLYGVVQAQNASDLQDGGEKAPDGDRSRHSNAGSFHEATSVENAKPTNDSSEVTPGDSKDNKESTDQPQDQKQEEFRSHEQLCREITVLPNAHIPVVLNPKFEFVPYESRLHEEANPMVSRIDINHLTQVQLREPPVRVSDFYRYNKTALQVQLNGKMGDQDKIELIFFILQKAFCIGQ